MMQTSKRGFSLLELLLVIFIISLVYYLGFEALGKPEKKPPLLSPKNLTLSIRHAPFFHGKGTLICTDRCTQCYFRESIASPFRQYRGETDLKGTVAYWIDADRTVHLLDYGHYQNKKVCLKIDFFANGSNTPVILKQNNKVYYIPSYFGPVKTFVSLAEAKNYRLRTALPIERQGDFY